MRSGRLSRWDSFFSGTPAGIGLCRGEGSAGDCEQPGFHPVLHGVLYICGMHIQRFSHSLRLEGARVPKHPKKHLQLGALSQF